MPLIIKLTTQLQRIRQTRKDTHIIIIFGSPNDNYTSVDLGSSVDEFVKTRSDLIGDAIKLNQDPKIKNVFSRSGNIKFNCETQLVIYTLLVNDKNHTVEIVSSVKPIVSIDSSLAKLQADTNRNIMKQNEGTNKTNNTVEGLTWVIVGWIPLNLQLYYEQMFGNLFS